MGRRHHWAAAAGGPTHLRRATVYAGGVVRMGRIPCPWEGGGGRETVMERRAPPNLVPAVAAAAAALRRQLKRMGGVMRQLAI